MDLFRRSYQIVLISALLRQKLPFLHFLLRLRHHPSRRRRHFLHRPRHFQCRSRPYRRHLPCRPAPASSRFPQAERSCPCRQSWCRHCCRSDSAACPCSACPLLPQAERPKAHSSAMSSVNSIFISFSSSVFMIVWEEKRNFMREDQFFSCVSARPRTRGRSQGQAERS